MGDTEKGTWSAAELGRFVRSEKYAKEREQEARGMATKRTGHTEGIAAAPELLAVLAEFVHDVELAGEDEVEREWPDLIVTFRNAQAAIAKATRRG